MIMHKLIVPGRAAGVGANDGNHRSRSVAVDSTGSPVPVGRRDPAANRRARSDVHRRFAPDPPGLHLGRHDRDRSPPLARTTMGSSRAAGIFTNLADVLAEAGVWQGPGPENRNCATTTSRARSHSVS